MRRVRLYLRPQGLAFFAFPAWQMPFGGHQQNCRNKMLSHLPYFHLLPKGMYRWILNRGGESPEAVKELLEIKRTATPIERFERLIREGALIMRPSSDSGRAGCSVFLPAYPGCATSTPLPVSTFCGNSDNLSFSAVPPALRCTKKVGQVSVIYLRRL